MDFITVVENCFMLFSVVAPIGNTKVLLGSLSHNCDIPTHIIVSMYDLHSSIKIPKGNSDVNEVMHIFRKIAYVYIFS